MIESTTDRGDTAPVRELAAPAAVSAAASSSAGLTAFRVAQQCVRVLPRSVVNVAGGGGARLLARFRPHRFDALRDNLRHVVPEADDAELERLVRANVANLARCWVDVMEMPYRPGQVAARLDVVSGLEHYTAARARGRGVVVVSMHFGAWEAGLAAWNRLGGELALLAERVQPEAFFERLLSARTAMGVHVIPIDAAAMRAADPAAARRLGAQAMREVLRLLRANGTIAIAIDRDITGGGEMLEFFGAPAPFPLGTVDVAIRAGAAVLPVTLTRAPGGRAHGWIHPEVTYDGAAPRSAEVRRVAAEILHLFEGLIRQHPEMWHVLERIWPPSAERR